MDHLDAIGPRRRQQALLVGGRLRRRLPVEIVVWTALRMRRIGAGLEPDPLHVDQEQRGFAGPERLVSFRQ
ncbi:hypothetical protein NKH10_19770 [Mesorhizobium sp. M1340]|uniref:hypothetical protein n=1 Tax=unclassified Mesorhizobium TaxID=325217 RepID=UPI0033373A2D